MKKGKKACSPFKEKDHYLCLHTKVTHWMLIMNDREQNNIDRFKTERFIFFLTIIRQIHVV